MEPVFAFAIKPAFEWLGVVIIVGGTLGFLLAVISEYFTQILANGIERGFKKIKKYLH